MRTILKDLLHAINVLGDDRDVYVDGYGTIAVCPPIKLTQEGLRHFNKSLNAAVEVIYKDDCHHSTYISDDEDASSIFKFPDCPILTFSFCRTPLTRVGVFCLAAIEPPYQVFTFVIVKSNSISYFLAISNQ